MNNITKFTCISLLFCNSVVSHAFEQDHIHMAMDDDMDMSMDMGMNMEMGNTVAPISVTSAGLQLEGLC